MEPQKPENLPLEDHSQAIEMLTQGQGLAFQLRDLFLNDPTPISEDRLVLAEDLLERIQGSFTDSISALDHASESDEMKSEESGESSKRTTFAKYCKTASASNRSKRKMSEGETWIEVASSLVDDGHAWRKYGQKPILNAKHSRNYYKCTHKDYFDCPAKKHVQKIRDDPLSYRTVYTFRHTCTTTTNSTLNPPPPTQLILESAAAQPDHTNPTSSSFMINFQSNQQGDLDRNREQLTLTDHNLGRSLSAAVGSDQVPPQLASTGMDGFMTSDIDQYSPAYMSYSHDSQDPWFS